MIVLGPSDVDESYAFVEHVASPALDRFECKIETIQHFPPVVEIREGVGLFDVERDAKNVRGPVDEDGFLLQGKILITRLACRESVSGSLDPLLLEMRVDELRDCHSWLGRVDQLKAVDGDILRCLVEICFAASAAYLLLRSIKRYARDASSSMCPQISRVSLLTDSNT